MSKKYLSTAALGVLASSFFLFSCVDNSYDLNKDIDLTIEVGGDAFMIPLGYTENITLDKMIDTTDVLRLDDDGLYSIKKADVIDDVDVSIDPVNVNIDNPELDPIELDFKESTVESFNVESMKSTSTAEVPEVSIDGINDELPKVNNHTPKEQHLGGSITGAGMPVEAEINVTPAEPIDCSVHYTYPTEVKRINKVTLGTGALGNKITITLDCSDFIGKLDNNSTTQKITDLTVTFPEKFELAADPNSFAGYVTIEHNKFILRNATLANEAVQDISFYVSAFEANSDDKIEYVGDITYELNYKLDGVSNGTAAISSLLLEVDVKSDLVMNEAEVVTNPIDVELGNKDDNKFTLNAEATGLKDISEVKIVHFNSESQLVLTIDPIQLPLDFAAGYINVNFPEYLSFDESKSTLHDSYFVIPSVLRIPYSSMFKPIILTLLRADLNREPVAQGNDAVLILNDDITYEAVGLQLGSKTLSSNKLVGLGAKTVEINVKGGEMLVDNAEVITNAVYSDVEEVSTFEVDQSVPVELDKIKTVTLKENTTAKAILKMDFVGYPDGLLLTPENLKVQIPSFVQCIREKTGAPVENGEFYLTDKIDPHTGYTEVLLITSLDFTSMPKGYVETKKGTDENRLVIDSDNDVIISGQVKTNQFAVSSDELKNITVNPTLTISEMEIGKVNGTVDPKIDPIDESIALDLGSDLDFLKEQGTDLNLKNPQISLTLSNTIGVPVDLTLTMCAKNLQGEVISADIPEQHLRLKKAEVDGEPTTTKFFLSKMKMGEPEDGFIEIPELSNLMTVVPDSVSFKITAKAATDEEHTVDLDKPMIITGEYDVIVPLEFESLDIQYKDTIDNLIDDLGDVSSKITHAELQVIIDEATNAVPVELGIDVTPMNIDGEKLDGITATVKTDYKDNKIKACVDENTPSINKIWITLKSDGDALKSLDKLELNVHATVEETVMGVPLKKTQFVKLSKMYIKVKKAHLDLND